MATTSAPMPPPDVQIVTIRHPRSGLVEKATSRSFRCNEWEWEPKRVDMDMHEARSARLYDYENGYGFGSELHGAERRKQKFAQMPIQVRQELKRLVYLQDIALYCWLTDAQVIRYEVEGVLEPQVDHIRAIVQLFRQLLPQHITITPESVEVRDVLSWEPEPDAIY